MESVPRLSLCIPTHALRTAFLKVALASAIQEALAFPAGTVEVLVSDNASTDHTAEVLRAFAPELRFRIRTENVGFFGNMVDLATEMARGRFVWALGDDDLILRGGLARALAALEAHPDVEVFYLNYGWIPIPARNRLILEGDSRMEPRAEDCHAAAGGVHRLHQ